LALGGQQVDNITITGAVVSGIGTGNGGSVLFERSKFGDCTLPEVAVVGSAIAGTITANEADSTYFFDRCASAVAGTGAPTFDFGSGLGNIALNLRHNSGGWNIQNMDSGDTMSLEGDGQLIVNANCSGGTVVIRGNIETSGAGLGNLTVTEDARFTKSGTADAVHDEVIEGAYTFRNLSRLFGAYVAGDLVISGTTYTYTGLDDATTRLVGTVNSAGRTMTTIDGD
jgi:hypothetical protein